MPLFFNSLLAQTGVEPAEVRLLRHKDKRSLRGLTPYELWRDQPGGLDAYQEAQGVDNRAHLNAPYWASFVATPSGDTLFTGLNRVQYAGLNAQDRPWPNLPSQVDPAGTIDLYRLAADERLSDLAGRLVIEWGAGQRTWIQRADNQNKVVLEIRDRFREPDFPGFAHFLSPLSKVERFPAGWIAALSASRGIYLLTCPKTKEQYVGSASGERGFYGRWLSYAQDGHGGNVGLKSRDPSDYQVSILEVAGSSATQQDILDLESLWKAKLQSQAMGLNRN